MIGCLRTRVRKQPIIALYFEFENELKFYKLGGGGGGQSLCCSHTHSMDVDEDSDQNLEL